MDMKVEPKITKPPNQPKHPAPAHKPKHLPTAWLTTGGSMTGRSPPDSSGTGVTWSDTRTHTAIVLSLSAAVAN